MTGGARWLPARAPPEVQKPRRTGQTRHGTSGANCAEHGWMAFPRRRPCAARCCFFHGGKSGERDRLPGRGAGPREAGGPRASAAQAWLVGWLVAPARRHPFLCFLLCKNSTAAPPLPRFRALTKHTKRDRESRQRQESPISSCPAQRALMPLPFGLL